MAVRSVPHTKAPRADKKAPVSGDIKRGPVSTRSHASRSPGVNETASRNNTPDNGKFNTVPNDKKF